LGELARHVSPGAFHDSSVRYPPPKCHAGTRKHILESITNWIETNTSTSRILWLYGSAGVGKSAIAQTIAEHCLTNDRLGAAFFFSRGDSERNNVNRLFPTLAWQLLSSISNIEAHISTSMKKDPFLPTRSIETQFEQLIASPFRLTADNNPARTSRIVIIDGVDECTDEMIQHRFLSLIGTGVNGGGLPLCFLICSRPEPHIREAFDQSISVSVTSRIVLDDAWDWYDDIKQYFVDEFSRISTENKIASDMWPPEGVVDRLVQNSSGQFIYAATVVKFVGDKYARPRKQLDIILGIRCRSGGSSPFADLDQLYLEILVRQPDQEFLRDFLNLWWLELEGHLRLPHSHFVRLGAIFLDLDLDAGELSAKLRGLHSLLDINMSDVQSIQPYHASFLDFLRDSTRSGQYCPDIQSALRLFVILFSRAMAKYFSKNQQTRCIFSIHEVQI
jgi:hypothetical protein